MWALIITLIVAAFIFFPFSMSLVTVKTFVLAAGALLTLALYILARLSRGNIIFPPFVLVGALWLPVIAYAFSAAFSGIPFTGALWGMALEPDTLGFILIATFLGTLAACVLRRPEHYRLFFRVAHGSSASSPFIEAIVRYYRTILIEDIAGIFAHRFVPGSRVLARPRHYRRSHFIQIFRTSAARISSAYCCRHRGASPDRHRECLQSSGCFSRSFLSASLLKR